MNSQTDNQGFGLVARRFAHIDSQTSDIDAAHNRGFDSAWIDDLRVLSQSLPLNDQQQELIKRRIENSERYALKGEPGAAMFEIKQAIGALKNMFGLKRLLSMWVAGEK